MILLDWLRLYEASKTKPMFYTYLVQTIEQKRPTKVRIDYFRWSIPIRSHGFQPARISFSEYQNELQPTWLHFTKTFLVASYWSYAGYRVFCLTRPGAVQLSFCNSWSWKDVDLYHLIHIYTRLRLFVVPEVLKASNTVLCILLLPFSAFSRMAMGDPLIHWSICIDKPIWEYCLNLTFKKTAESALWECIYGIRRVWQVLSGALGEDVKEVWRREMPFSAKNGLVFRRCTR